MPEHAFQLRSNTVGVKDRGHPCPGEPLDVTETPDKELQPERLLILVTEAVATVAGVTLDQQCIKKGEIIIYCTDRAGYFMQVSAIRTNGLLKLTVWVQPKRVGATVEDIENAGERVLNEVRRELAERVGVA